MDEENETQKDVKGELKRLQVVRFAFAITNIILLMSGPMQDMYFCITNSDELAQVDTKYAWYNCIKTVVALTVILSANIYLLAMAVRMRQLFREFKMVRGYSGEVFLAFFMLIYLFFLIYLSLEPFVTVLIFTSDFACTDAVNNFMQVVSDINSAFWPLSTQAVFIGVMWQLSRIQVEFGAQIDETTT